MIYEKILFKSAKELNNDLLILLSVLRDAEVKSSQGESIKNNFIEIIENHLNSLEDSIVVIKNQA